MFDFLQVKNTVSSVKTRLAEIDKELSSLRDQQAKIVPLPLPFDDFIDWCTEQVDMVAEDWPREIHGDVMGTHLADHTKKRGAGYDTTAVFEEVYMTPRFSFPVFNIHGPNNAMAFSALCWCLRDQIKEGFRSAITSAIGHKWPKEVGLPRKQRVIELRKIDAEIDKLTSERDRISSQLAELGVAV